MCPCFKEVLTLLLAHLLNGDRLSQVNMLGLVLCISGMLIHARSRTPHAVPRAVISGSTIPIAEVHETSDTRRLLADYS
jgi:hypothetical protein